MIKLQAGRALLAASMVSLARFAAADASSQELARCAAIVAPDDRLSCYDALAGRPGRAPVGRPSPPATTAVDDGKNFGLTPAQVQAPLPKGPSKVQARIESISGGGLARLTVVLDNAQTWTFSEAADDAQLKAGDIVTIKRAALGSFLLVTPASRSYHVHRVH